MDNKYNFWLTVKQRWVLTVHVKSFSLCIVTVSCKLDGWRILAERGCFPQSLIYTDFQRTQGVSYTLLSYSRFSMGHTQVFSKINILRCDSSSASCFGRADLDKTPEHREAWAVWRARQTWQLLPNSCLQLPHPCFGHLWSLLAALWQVSAMQSSLQLHYTRLVGVGRCWHCRSLLTTFKNCYLLQQNF